LKWGNYSSGYVRASTGAFGISDIRDVSRADSASR
jgi:hypothetical protein